MLAAGVDFEQIDPVNTPAMRACHALTEAGSPVDHPHLPALSFEGFKNWWFHSDDRQESWLAAVPIAGTNRSECQFGVGPVRPNTGGFHG